MGKGALKMMSDTGFSASLLNHMDKQQGRKTTYSEIKYWQKIRWLQSDHRRLKLEFRQKVTERSFLIFFQGGG